MPKERANRIIMEWLRAGTYRVVMQRHDGCWRAVDESSKLVINADTAEGLAAELDTNTEFVIKSETCPNPPIDQAQRPGDQNA